MIKFYKYLRGISAPIIKEDFRKTILKKNLRNYRLTILANPKTKKYTTDAVIHKAAQLWSTLPTRYKHFHRLIYSNPK